GGGGGGGWGGGRGRGGPVASGCFGDRGNADSGFARPPSGALVSARGAGAFPARRRSPHRGLHAALDRTSGDGGRHRGGAACHLMVRGSVRPLSRGRLAGRRRLVPRLPRRRRVREG